MENRFQQAQFLGLKHIKMRSTQTPLGEKLTEPPRSHAGFWERANKKGEKEKREKEKQEKGGGGKTEGGNLSQALLHSQQQYV